MLCCVCRDVQNEIVGLWDCECDVFVRLLYVLCGPVVRDVQLLGLSWLDLRALVTWRQVLAPMHACI